jgi:hypothetical protein
MEPDSTDLGFAALASDREFFSKSGPLPMKWSEVRRFPRFYLRSEASASIQAPRSAWDSESKRIDVLTCDVSRGGIGIRCGELLFPEQRLQLEMPDGATYALKVVWCRRLGPGRYAAGCVFQETSAES